MEFRWLPIAQLLVPSPAAPMQLNGDDMRLLGEAAVAMWWHVDDEHLEEFHEWHSKEHLPERLRIPGFRRGTRWQAQDAGEFFVLYELESYETLTSAAYQERLNYPTPWSAKMMPRHLGMTRSQCRVRASRGGGLSAWMSTIRLSPAPGQERRLEAYVLSIIESLPQRPGGTGAHFLCTDTPAAARTREQMMRGGDAVADWIVLVSGHDKNLLCELCDTTLGFAKLRDNGAVEVNSHEPYLLVHAVTAQDVATG